MSSHHHATVSNTGRVHSSNSESSNDVQEFLNDESDCDCDEAMDNFIMAYPERQGEPLTGFNLGTKLHPVEVEIHQPAAKKAKLKGFDIASLTRLDFVDKFKRSWVDSTEMKTDHVQLMVEPFKVCSIDNFLSEPAPLQELRDAFNCIEWHKRNLDLYEFFQSSDISQLKEGILMQFYDFLQRQVMPWMSELTGKELVKVSATCSFYSDTDYLLVHDDLRSDRAIAFIFYISDVEWKPEMGGALEVIGKDDDGQPTLSSSKLLFPRNNKLVFFEVTNYSYHQVKEVFNLDRCRMSINGWFHYNTPNPYECIEMKTPQSGLFSSDHQSPIDTKVSLADWISPQYLRSDNREQIQKQIESDSEISLHSFLHRDKYEQLCEAILSDDIQWIREGPPNRRNYETINTNNIPSIISEFLTLLRSNEMFSLLKDYTDLDLVESEVAKPSLRMELQRWSGGCYSLLSEYDWESEKELDLVMYINCPFSTVVGGQTMYISTEDREEDALITLDPSDNVLNIVFRDTARIIKRVSERSQIKYFYLLICSYKERTCSSPSLINRGVSFLKP